MQELVNQAYGYLYGMWRYRWSALVIAWIVALGGWLSVYTLPDQYQSSAVVHIDTDSVIKPLLSGLAVEDAMSDLGVMSRVLLSRENLLRVIHETDMDLDVNTSEGRNNLAAKLAGAVKLNAKTESNDPKAIKDIYEISIQTTSAETSYHVVSNLLNTFIENTLNAKRTDGIVAQKFLDDQIAEYEKRLSIAEQELATFKKENVGHMPDETGGYYLRLQGANDDIENTRWELRLAQRRNSELRKQLSGESPLLNDSSYGVASALRLRQYQEDLNTLLNQYTEQHPDVQALRATIADLKANKQTGGEDEVIALGTGDTIEFNPVYQDLKAEMSKASIDVESLRAQLAQKERRVEELKKSIDIIPGVEAQLAKLNRDYDVTQGRYLDLVDRRESARLSQEVGQSAGKVHIRVIEPPRVAFYPVGPPRPLYLTGVLIGAIGIGLGWGLLRYLLQPTFISLQQIKKSIGLPVLGSVSLFITTEHRARRKRQLAMFISATVVLIGVFGGAMFFGDAGSVMVRSLLPEAGAL